MVGEDPRADFGDGEGGTVGGGVGQEGVGYEGWEGGGADLVGLEG